jgi:hypothetical protein
MRASFPDFAAWLVPLLLLLGGVCWVYCERTLFVQGLRSLRWQRTKGRIIDQEDRSFLVPGIVGSAGTGIGLVQYLETGYYFEFQVGMTRYVNDTYCFGVHLDKAVGHYIVGDYVPVYFDPKNPRNSVLRRGVPPGTMISIVPVVIGLGVIIWRLCA